MMRQSGKFRYCEIKKAQLLELPYVGKKLSMVIILPNNPENLSDIENQFTVKNLDDWLSRLSKRDVNIYLPKFKVTWGTFELNKSLQDIGMKNAFSSDADFSGMDGTKSLFIGSVLHKAFVEVNEEGTEATAATAICITKGEEVIQNRGRVYTFLADHPFLFLIRDNDTGNILFFGRMLDPSN